MLRSAWLMVAVVGSVGCPPGRICTDSDPDGWVTRATGNRDCGARCEFILVDVPESAIADFQEVSQEGVPTTTAPYAARKRTLKGTLAGHVTTSIVPMASLPPGYYMIRLNAVPHREQINHVTTSTSLPVPGILGVTVMTTPGDAAWGNECGEQGPPPPPRRVAVDKHHLRIETTVNAGQSLDLWIVRNNASPGPDSDAFTIPVDAPWVERAAPGTFTTRGVVEDPGLSTGETVRIAVRAVNADGFAGPVTLSDPVTITEKAQEWNNGGTSP